MKCKTRTNWWIFISNFLDYVIRLLICFSLKHAPNPNANLTLSTWDWSYILCLWYQNIHKLFLNSPSWIFWEDLALRSFPFFIFFTPQLCVLLVRLIQFFHQQRTVGRPESGSSHCHSMSHCSGYLFYEDGVLCFLYALLIENHQRNSNAMTY